MKRANSNNAAMIAFAGALLLLATAVRASADVEPGGQSNARTPRYRIVTDDVGREVKMPIEVNRIVTLAPNLTEIVYALGLADKLAGDTNECDSPPAAKSKPHVGEPQNPNLEAIIALHPDLVLATTAINRVETADALGRLGIAVYTSDGEAETVLGILDSIARMADLMLAQAKGADLVAQMRRRLDELHKRLEDRPMVHVLFVVWLDPLTTIGQKTFIADALRWAGTESVVLSKQTWPQISMEEVIRLEPDYIVFAGTHGESKATELTDLRSRPVWRDLDAVQVGHVVNLNQEVIRPSPGLVDAIEQLARQVHPEAFARRSENRGPSSEIPAEEPIRCAR
ncbi:MAG TPA: ABC transporter substrate-binding protein [Candidatus Acidoferrales bacterium]|nr:ABC transporter substrate-binding protein [Candidatus Acidoferrales bacterium]